MSSWGEAIGAALMDTTIILGLEALVGYSDGSRTFAGDRNAAVKFIGSSRPFLFLTNLNRKSLPTPVVDLETRVGEIFERFMVKEGESFNLVVNRPTPTSVQITRTSGSLTASVSPNTTSTLTWLIPLLALLGALLLALIVYLVFTYVIGISRSRKAAHDELTTSQEQNREMQSFVTEKQKINTELFEALTSSNSKYDELLSMMSTTQTSNQEQGKVIDDLLKKMATEQTSNQKQEKVIDDLLKKIATEQTSKETQKKVIDEQRILIDGQENAIQGHLKVINERGEMIDRQKDTINVHIATVDHLSKSLQTLESAREKSNAPSSLMHTKEAQLQETRKDLAAASEQVKDPEVNEEETSPQRAVQKEIEEAEIEVGESKEETSKGEEAKKDEPKEEETRVAEKAAPATNSQQQMATESTETSPSSSIGDSACPPTTPAVVSEIRPEASANSKLDEFRAFMEHSPTPTANTQSYWVTPPAGSKRSKVTGEIQFLSLNEQWADHCWKAKKDLGYTDRQARNAGVGTDWPNPERYDHGLKRAEHADRIRNSYPPFLAFKAAKVEEERRKAAYTSSSSSAAQLSPPAPPASFSAALTPSPPVVVPSPTPSPVDNNRVVHKQSRGDAMRNIRMGPMHGQRAPVVATPPASSGRVFPAMLGHHQVHRPSPTPRPNPTAQPFHPRPAQQWSSQATTGSVRKAEDDANKE